MVLHADNGGTGTGTASFTGGSVSLAGGTAQIFYDPPGSAGTKYTTPTNFVPNVSGGTLTAYMLVNNATDLQNISTNLSGTYAQSQSIAAGSGFTPIGSFATPFIGLLDGEGCLAFTTSATSSSHVGIYGVSASGQRSPNYAIDYINGTLSVTPAPITVTAENVSRGAGQANPPFVASISAPTFGPQSPLVSGLSFQSPATPASPAGSYPIIPFGATAGPDYAIVYVDGLLTVTGTGTVSSAPTIESAMPGNFAAAYDNYQRLTDWVRTPTSPSWATIGGPIFSGLGFALGPTGHALSAAGSDPSCSDDPLRAATLCTQPTSLDPSAFLLRPEVVASRVGRDPIARP